MRCKCLLINKCNLFSSLTSFFLLFFLRGRRVQLLFAPTVNAATGLHLLLVLLLTQKLIALAIWKSKTKANKRNERVSEKTLHK